MAAFINGIGMISAQDTFGKEEQSVTFQAAASNRVICREPDYKAFIKPIKLRRMSRVLKMGVTSAKQALNQAGIDNPDAIIVGTGLGIIEDTEKFLLSMLENGETLLTPTSFIQSTHNTVGAHIAVMLQCNNHNFTHVNGFTSFENALFEAILLIKESPTSNILVGGVDEMTDRHFDITESAGFWKKNMDQSLPLPEQQGRGSISGEGAGFFVISGGRSEKSIAVIKDVETFYSPNGDKDHHDFILRFLEKNNLTIHDINLALLGYNGDEQSDKFYKYISQKHLKTIPTGFYKHLSGEFYTASAFAAYLAATIIKNQTVPDEILTPGSTYNENSIQNILIYNQHNNKNHSVCLVSKC